MKIIIASLIALLGMQAAANNGGYDPELVRGNALKVLQRIVPQSHQEFAPPSNSDISELRLERTGVIDFTYTSQDGKFRGNLYCHLSQLITYTEQRSKQEDVCFRLNVFEKDSSAVNGFGRQVGIY